MENTLENKEKFICQYAGQDIAFIIDEDNDSGVSKYPYKAVTNCMLREISYLELTPLEQISDEDAIEVAKIENSWDTEDYLLRGKNIVKWMFGEHTYYVDKTVKRIYIVDFLRSKGYAVPFMDLSIEDLVSYGWVKLK